MYMHVYIHTYTHTGLEITNESNWIKRFKINVHKYPVFLYASNEWSKNEIKKTIMFKRIKYLAKYLTKEIKTCTTEI